MTTDPASLLGLPVHHRDLRLGTVSNVLLARDAGWAVAMVVSSAWGGSSYLLPVGAATIHADRIETSPFGLLSEAVAVDYRRRGRALVGERVARGRV